MTCALAVRWRTLSFAVCAAVGFAACSNDVAGGETTPRSARAELVCAGSSPEPGFALDRTDSTATMLVLSTPRGGAPFKAFVELARGAPPAVIGGELTPSTVPDGAIGSSAFYTASLPAVAAGTYAVTLQVVQFTNLAPECQKSFAVALGTLTLR